MPGKKLSLPESIKLYDFTKLSKSEPNPRTRIRLIALSHIKSGISLIETAIALNVTRKTVGNWLKF
jgi:hypothetical protein